MSEATRYLDGFLAAALPGTQRAGIEPPAPIAQTAPATAPAPPTVEAEVPVEERIKRRLHPLDSFPRLLECVEANLPPTPDDQFRFRWFGLFYQAPRQDAFLLRLRLPGGRLQAFQLAGLAEITQRCAAGCVLLNSRGGLDIPGVPLPMAAEILHGIEGIGLSARQTGGDCVQSIQGGEYDGWKDSGTRLERVYPLVCRLEQALAYNRRLADLPSGCEIVFRSADEPLAIGGDDLPNTLVLRTMADPPGSRSDQETCFMLVVPGEPEGGWLLSSSQVVPSCLKFLEAWASEADRTYRQNAGLALYCHTLGRERIGGLLAKAEWQPKPRLPKFGPTAPTMPPLAGLPVPDGRLLSNQLRRIGQILQERNLSGIRLARGKLCPTPEANSQIEEAVCRVLNN